MINNDQDYKLILKDKDNIPSQQKHHTYIPNPNSCNSSMLNLMDENSSSGHEYNTCFQSQMRQKINKMQQDPLPTCTFEVQIRRVRILSQDKKKLSGFLETVDGMARHLVHFHRNDFKNRFWMLRLIAAMDMHFTVLVVWDMHRVRKLLCVHKIFLSGMKDLLYRLKITRQDMFNLEFDLKTH